MKRAKAIFLITIFLVCLAGCGGNAEEEEKELLTFSPVGEIVDGQPDIYVIVKVKDSQYWQKVQDGTAAAGREAGANIYVGGTESENDISGQTSLLETALEKKADAVLIAPLDSEAMADSIKEAYSKDIPIVLIDTIINSNDYDVCYMTDNMDAGKMAAREMLRLLKESGLTVKEDAKVAIQVGVVHSQSIIDRLAGFNAYWAVNAPDRWEVLEAVESDNGDKERAKEVTEKILKENQDIQGIYCTNDISTSGAASELLRQGREDVVLAGFDYSNEMAALLNAEENYGVTVVQQQYQMGYQGVKAAMEILAGEKPERKFVDTGVFIVDRMNAVAEEVRQRLMD